MYRDVTRSSTPWIGGAPPEGQTCQEACRLASRQVHYNWRCEGRNPRYLVLIEETTAITGCAPVTDSTGKATGCEGTAQKTKIEIHTDTPSPWVPPEGDGALTTAFQQALAKVKRRKR